MSVQSWAVVRRAFREHPTAIAAVVLFLVALAFFSPVLVGQSFTTLAAHESVVYPWCVTVSGFAFYPQSDQSELNHPWNSFLADSLRRADFPFWNPLMFYGEPFYANGSSALLYPPRLLAALLIDSGLSHDLFCFLHVFGAGFFMWLLARDLGQSPLAAALAAVAWMFGGLTMAWLHLEVVTPIVVYLPLGLLCVRRVWARHTAGSLLTAVLVLGGFLCAGHLPFMGLTWGVIVAYAACVGAREVVRARFAGREAASSVLYLLVLVAGSIGVAAPVLVPSALHLFSSQRTIPAYDLVLSGRPPLQALAGFIVPPRLPFGGRELHEHLFVGHATLALSVLALTRRGRGRGLGFVLGVTALLYALETPLARLTISCVPPVALLRPLGRALYLVEFSLALLGGAGLDAIRDRLRAGVTTARAAPTPLTPVRPSSHLARWAMPVLAVIVLGTGIQLMVLGRRVNPPPHPRQSALRFPATPLVEALVEEQRRLGGRVIIATALGPDGGWTPPVMPGAIPMVFGLEIVGGFESVVPTRSLQLVRLLAGENVKVVLDGPDIGSAKPAFMLGSVRLELLSRLDASILVASPQADHDPGWARFRDLPLHPVYDGPDGRVYRLETQVTGAYVVHRADLVQSGRAAVVQLLDPRFDFGKVVLLEDPDSSGGSLGEIAQEPSARVGLVAKRNGSALYVVESDRPGWLVIPATWAPGWQARVGAHEVEVRRANYAFQAVEVPAGRSEVRLRYEPPGLVLGWFLALASTLPLLAAACREVHARRLRVGSWQDEGGRTEVAKPP